MRKIIAIIPAVMLVMSMAVPALACTPKLKIPDMPDIPDISGNIQIDTKPAVDKWFDEHPIVIDWSKFDWSKWWRK